MKLALTFYKLNNNSVRSRNQFIQVPLIVCVLLLSAGKVINPGVKIDAVLIKLVPDEAPSKLLSIVPSSISD